MYDFLIVGQGVAGSLLAWELAKAGKSVFVIDKGNPYSTSNVASGIVNPITGKRFVKSWLMDEIQPFSLKCYREIEHDLNVNFLSELSIYHVLNSVQEINDWSAKAATFHYEKYLSTSEIHYLDKEKVRNPNGCFEINGALKISASNFLSAIKNWLEAKYCYSEEVFEEAALNESRDFVEYKNVRAEKAIFATGYDEFFLKKHSNVKFSPVKGEGLVVEISDFFSENIVQGNVMISPTMAKGIYYVGSTYEWNFRDELPTESRKSELIERLKDTINCNFKVLEHVAGIRPASADRRPILGFFPNSRIGIFNGMGTKGFSLSPYFAKHFCDSLVAGKALLPEVDLKRFF
ncbi:MAG TPA: FAD-dependent oxidoreductase [Chitinophagales bacterium]|nr:FAD-dependent oxidoreductase [Chitinophagales bacterium]